MYIGFTHFDAHLANVMITRKNKKLLYLYKYKWLIIKK